MNPACEGFLPMLSAYADEEVGASERRALELHLSACKECQSRLDDLKVTRQVLHQALLAQADAVDFSGFSQKVMARITPRPEPVMVRLGVWWSEVWTHQRAIILTSFATAALALGIGGPVIWNLARQSRGNEVVVHSLQSDNPNLTPVVLQTDDGATMVMFVDHAEDEGSASPPQEEIKLPDPETPREEKL